MSKIEQLNPWRIPNAFRLQTLIEEELALAKTIVTEEKMDAFSSEDYIKLALTFLEVGDWENAQQYTASAWNREALKSEDKRSNEVWASAFYLRATWLREIKECKDALAIYHRALELAQSAWLISNILRNLGITHLVMQNFEAAYEDFTAAYKRASEDAALKGSLPALLNYRALTLTRVKLNKGESPAEGLALFEEATKLYQTLFAEFGISAEERLKSHDYLSHLFHYAMIICEIAEKANKEAKEDHTSNLLKSEQILLEVLEGRTKNKAGHQRLGDVCASLGRVYTGLNRTQEAEHYFNVALDHFRAVSAKAPESQQFKDIEKRLLDLKQGAKPMIPSPRGPSIFALPPQPPKDKEPAPQASRFSLLS